VDKNSRIKTIITYLSAHQPAEVKEAVKIWARMNVSMRLERKEGMAGNPWRPLAAGEDVPPDHDYMTINGQVMVRLSAAAQQSQQQQAVGRVARPRLSAPRADTTPAMTDKKCPACGEPMVYEPICPGCKLGRQGFAGRYICTDNTDHDFYVPRPDAVFSD